MQYDYLIVGSGLSGCVFAHEMTRRGKKCLVLERRDHVGGNIYTQAVEGIQVHRYGAHIFHTDKREIWDYVNRFAPFNGFVNSPVANYRGELYNLPFNMNTFVRMWPVRTPAEARAMIASQQAGGGGEPQNLEEQAIRLVGRDLYEKLIRGYTQKQWGRPCTELPAFIIRRIPVRFTFDNNYFQDRYQGIPEGGYTAIAEKLLEGSDVLLGTDFNAERRRYEGLGARVLYTGPVDAFYRYCYGRLQYRSLRFEQEVLDTPNHQGVAVMNYTDEETPYTRVIEHKHFAFGTQPRTVISREYPLAFGEGCEPFYPVNDERNNALCASYAALAREEKRVLFLGRLAQYRYIDMDQAIEGALALVQEELHREGL